MSARRERTKVTGFKRRAQHWRGLLYSKISNIFVIDGDAPETLDKNFLIYCIEHFGKAVIIKHGGEIYVQPFVYAGTYTANYKPKQGIITNPYWSGAQTVTFEILDNAVVTDSVNNFWDSYGYSGTYGYGVISNLVWKTSRQLANNDISFECLQRNARLIGLVETKDDKTTQAIKAYIDKAFDGEPLIISDTDLMSDIKVNPLAQNFHGDIIELIELNQYIIANFLHTFGINSNYNLKRAQLQADEIAVNEYALKLNLTDILNGIQQGLDKANEMYGLNLRVKKNPEIYAENENNVEKEVEKVEKDENDLEADSGADSTDEPA